MKSPRKSPRGLQKPNLFKRVTRSFNRTKKQPELLPCYSDPSPVAVDSRDEDCCSETSSRAGEFISTTKANLSILVEESETTDDGIEASVHGDMEASGHDDGIFLTPREQPGEEMAETQYSAIESSAKKSGPGKAGNKDSVNTQKETMEEGKSEQMKTEGVPTVESGAAEAKYSTIEPAAKESEQGKTGNTVSVNTQKETMEQEKSEKQVNAENVPTVETGANDELVTKEQIQEILKPVGPTMSKATLMSLDTMFHGASPEHEKAETNEGTAEMVENISNASPEQVELESKKASVCTGADSENIDLTSIKDEASASSMKQGKSKPAIAATPKTDRCAVDPSSATEKEDMEPYPNTESEPHTMAKNNEGELGSSMLVAPSVAVEEDVMQPSPRSVPEDHNPDANEPLAPMDKIDQLASEIEPEPQDSTKPNQIIPVVDSIQEKESEASTGEMIAKNETESKKENTTVEPASNAHQDTAAKMALLSGSRNSVSDKEATTREISQQPDNEVLDTIVDSTDVKEDSPQGCLNMPCVKIPTELPKPAGPLGSSFMTENEGSRATTENGASKTTMETLDDGFDRWCLLSEDDGPPVGCGEISKEKPVSTVISWLEAVNEAIDDKCCWGIPKPESDDITISKKTDELASTLALEEESEPKGPQIEIKD